MIYTGKTHDLGLYAETLITITEALVVMLRIINM